MLKVSNTTTPPFLYNDEQNFCTIKYRPTNGEQNWFDYLKPSTFQNMTGVLYHDLTLTTTLLDHSFGNASVPQPACRKRNDARLSGQSGKGSVFPTRFGRAGSMSYGADH